MKTVSILAFQFADNYGALLQIYGLQQILNQLGLEVEVINFRPTKLEETYSFGFNIADSLKSDGFYMTSRKAISRTIKSKKIFERRKIFRNFRKEHLNLTKKSLYNSKDIVKELPKYDYYFVGSDQVWNPYFFKKAGLTYFLDYAPENSKKISYAASIAQSIEPKYEKVFSNELPKFDSISVREESARRKLVQLTNLDITTTLDPTLLLKKDKWLELISEKKTYEPFILVYDLEYSETIMKVANEISNKTGYKIVSYTGKRKYINRYFSFSKIGPSELMRLFDEAEYVVTSSFHGTAFSVIFEKNFYTIPHSTRGSRMIDFLSSIGLENRILKEPGIPSDYYLDIDYKKPNDKLDDLRKHSLEFIKNSLN